MANSKTSSDSLNSEISSQPKLQSSHFLNYKVDRIALINCARNFSKVLVRLQIVPISDDEWQQVYIYRKYGNEQGAQEYLNNRSAFGLKEAKDFVIRLYPFDKEELKQRFTKGAK